MTADGPDAAEQLRYLHEWLGEVGELRGRVSLDERPPEPGTLGPVVDALVVALGPAGAATACAAAVLAWLRTRRGRVRIKVTLPGRRSAELDAEKVAKLDAAALQQLAAQLAAMLEQGELPPGDR
ncbi:MULTISPECIES: hypothetical protein [unclassified Crossiella]|uniref:effector-associated constant component EACC1 n=1 Tax=unclassified Crossiella TaxID=2620835 RepID=UPI001FFF1EC9|nr:MULTISPECIES: hypothetical protein [unclassified Crossiella]MCK2239914.1 hypothetical protein [Crossiella sp. S99.2]MCK2252622.1 hypothetical protein [Crossiella sp. S99.1]